MCLLVLFASSIGLFSAVIKSAQSLHKLGAHVKGGGKITNAVKVGSRMVVLLGTNAACWIPILIVSSLMLADVEIHEQVLQWMVILVIPLGATLDPILYNLQLFKDAFQKLKCKK